MHFFDTEVVRLRKAFPTSTGTHSEPKRKTIVFMPDFAKSAYGLPTKTRRRTHLSGHPLWTGSSDSTLLAVGTAGEGVITSGNGVGCSLRGVFRLKSARA